MPSNFRGSRRNALKAIAAGTLAPLLSACHGRDASSLEFWTLALSPWFDAFIRERLDSFQAANPEISVRWVDIPFEALERKLIAAAAAGRAPDVVNMSDLNFARFAALGAFRDITDQLPADVPPRYLPSAMSLCRMRTRASSQLLGLPWYVNTQVLLANTSMLGAGFGTEFRTRLNTDWEGLIAIAPGYRKTTGRFLFSQALGEESEVPQMLLANGTPPFATGPDGSLVAAIDTPPIASFLELWVRLYRDGNLPREAATKGHSHLTEGFQQSELALANTGPNFLKRIRDVAPDVYAVTEALPGMTGKLGRGHIPVMILGVTNQSLAPKSAARLAAFMTSPDSQLAFCRQATILPSTVESLRDPFFAPPDNNSLASPDGKLLAARAVTAHSVETAAAFSCGMQTWPDLRRIFQTHFQRVLLENRPLESTLRTINSEWNRMLASSPPVTMEVVPTPPPIPLPDRSRTSIN